jgi:hypothetical protein
MPWFASYDHEEQIYMCVGRGRGRGRGRACELMETVEISFSSSFTQNLSLFYMLLKNEFETSVLAVVFG